MSKKAFLEKTLSKVSSIYKKRNLQLFADDIDYIKLNVSKLSNSIVIQAAEDETVVDELVAILVKDIKDRRVSDEKFNKSPDMHEVLKRELGPSETSNSRMPLGDFYNGNVAGHLLNLFGTRDASQLGSIFNPSSQLAKAYLVLDRKYSYTKDNQTFSWNISTDGVANNGQNIVGTIAPLKDIVKIRMLPMRFPNTTGAINALGRLSVLIDELSNQSYNTYERMFHFMFNVWYFDATAPTTSPLLLTDLGNSPTEFEFFRPIFELTTMSVSFANPFVRLTLDSDTAVATLSPSGVKTQLTFTTDPRIVTGNLVIISSFTTSNSVADAAIITAMNNPFGHAVDHSTSDYFINVDLSSLVGSIVGNPYSIYLDSKRFVISLELTYKNSYK